MVDSPGFADIMTIGSAIAADIIFIDVKYRTCFIIQMLHIASIIIKTVTMVNQIVWEVGAETNGISANLSVSSGGL